MPLVRLVFDPSTCVNFSNICFRKSAGLPDPDRSPRETLVLTNRHDSNLTPPPQSEKSAAFNSKFVMT